MSDPNRSPDNPDDRDRIDVDRDQVEADTDDSPRGGAGMTDDPAQTTENVDRSTMGPDHEVADTDPGSPGGSTGRTSMPDRRTRSYLSAIAALLGAWIAVSPFVYEGMVGAETWNNVLVGAAIFLAAGYNYYRQRNGMPTNVGAAGLAALLGLWLVIAAFLLDMGTGAFWSTLVSGALIAVMAGANAYVSREARPVATEGEPVNRP